MDPRCRCSVWSTAPPWCHCCPRRTSNGSATATPGPTPAAWVPTPRCRGCLTMSPPHRARCRRTGRRRIGPPWLPVLRPALRGPGHHTGRPLRGRIQLSLRRSGDPGRAGSAGVTSGWAAYATATGALADFPALQWQHGNAVTVVLAAHNYPGSPRVGDVITGSDGEGILHAGTVRGEDGSVVSAGGRVLSVVATGTDLAAARDAVYRRLAVDRFTRRPFPHRHRASRRRGENRAVTGLGDHHLRPARSRGQQRRQPGDLTRQLRTPVAGVVPAGGEAAGRRVG